MEASGMVRELSGAALLAGGTDLLPLMKLDIVQPTTLIDIKRTQGLSGIRAGDDGSLTIGALTTLATIESDPLIREWAPLLAKAASLAATPQIRNRATVGGNLLQRP